MDDNTDILELLGDSLGLVGFEVKTASSGAGALALLPDFHPDLVILDVQMPEMDGQGFLDSAERIQEAPLKDTKVVFSSAGRPPLDRRVCGFIDKMTDLPEYIRRVEFFLGHEACLPQAG